jgi:hypothetical protein
VIEDENPQTEDFYAENEEIKMFKNPQSSTPLNPAPFSKGAQENENIQDSSEQTSQNDEDTQEDEDLDEELEPELIISEVYYDGKDERIEIYNI